MNLDIIRKAFSNLSKDELDEVLDFFSKTHAVLGTVFDNKDRVGNLAQITSDAGDLLAGRFIATSGGQTEPTDQFFSGAFISASGETFGNTLAYIGSVLNGVLQAAITESGGIYALGGNMVINSSGQSMTGLLLPLYFTATNEGEQRQAWLGLSVQQGSTAPVFSVLFTGPDGENLVSNGDAGTLDLTDWTDAEGDWEVTSDNAYSITYPSSFRHIGSGEFPAYLIQNVTVTAGDILSFGYASYLHEGILSGRARLKWKNGGGSVIQTDTLYGSGGAWQYSQQTYIAPTSTASVDIEFDAGDPFNDWRITFIQLFVQSVSNELRFSDEDLTAIVNGTEYDLLSKNPETLYASNVETTISTSGTTNIFSITLPSNFFTNHHLIWRAEGFIDQNANNRTITLTQTLDGTSFAVELGGGGANAITVWEFKGSIGSGGTNIQNNKLFMQSVTNASNTQQIEWEHSETTKTESSALVLTVSIGISGSVDSGWFDNVLVQAVKNAP